MSRRVLTWIAAGLLIVVAALVFWPRSDRQISGQGNVAAGNLAQPGGSTSRVSTTNQFNVPNAGAPAFLAEANTNSAAVIKTNSLAYRLANTTKPIGQLLRDDRAILLENALIDTTKPLGFKIPNRLRAEGDPGSYLVQARGLADAAFRATVEAAGAELISYIPNNAWLVRASADEASRLQADGQIQTVLPWEPVYKLKAELLQLAMEEKPLASDAKLNLLVFGGAQNDVAAQLQQMNVTVLHRERSPFGTVVTVQPPEDWVALAKLSGVQLMEQAYRRAAANDRTRMRLGITEDTQTQTNYLGLSGSNILVSLNDSGVSVVHPDLTNRVFTSTAGAGLDPNGHGTHVAGIIMGSGEMSLLWATNARGSVSPVNTNQFRGMAPGAKLYVQQLTFGTNDLDDGILQEGVARTNAFISNNSWVYAGASSYSLASASYDAAVRDSLPGTTGSQPVLYVFPAGNSGGGSDDGFGGNAGSVLSPGTAKNVVTVGALELARDITNIVEKITGSGTNVFTNTTTYWKGMTSSENQVAGFSSRGNVGIGIEGEFGRFKPDVVAPGTFVVSTRSTEWDEEAYYNPTNHQFTLIANQSVQTNALGRYNIFLPQNAVGFAIYLIPNEDSPPVFPNLPIYVRRNDQPTTTAFDLLRTNFVAVPPDLGGPGTTVGQNWYYAIGNRTGSRVFFDIITEVITTNDLGNYHVVLSNLNNSISGTNFAEGTPPNYYRYESGTSIAAPAVSGTLALMQEFFEQGYLAGGVRKTNSPALMKALLINGARSAGDDYNFQVRNAINYQGWGVVRLENSLQAGITNAFNYTGPSSMLVYDQSPTNALATGFKQTWNIVPDEDGQLLPLRVTLAWTDPPGNPAAGVKLVNDLDLIITNNSTGEIFLGNDFEGGGQTSSSWDTNNPPNYDSVNNVENIYLPAPLDGTNYSITVIARRVNVNAVTAHTNDVVQDFALVISSGAGEVATTLTLTNNSGVITNRSADVIRMTNSINTPTFSGGLLVNQRVGANPALLGTTNTALTNGLVSQWKFYVMQNNTASTSTNGVAFTNATFLISQQTDLAIPRQGVNASILLEATRRYADLDLYVSTDPALTNLEPNVLAASLQSRSRNDLSGDEFVTFSNSFEGATYYIGVKSEDQQAAQFEFWGIFSLFPLGQEDANGYVRAYPMSGFEIPDGGPSRPGGTRFIAITRPSTSGGAESVRRVLVTNNIVHARFADLINTMDHNSRVVVLDNHRELLNPPSPGPYGLFYDDSGERDFLNAVPPDGPGTFESFVGEQPGGTWYFTYSDDGLTQTGRVNDVLLKVERQPEDDSLVTNTVAANSWRYFSRNVPVEATNLTVCISNITSGTQSPLKLYIRKNRRPTETVYDYSMTVFPPGDCLSVNKFSIPPLTAGRYFIGIFNDNPTEQTFVYYSRVDLGLTPIPSSFGSGGNVPLRDDAVTDQGIFITNNALIAQVDVGLRIEHPRVSDLAVTLISPRGTRVLLSENRGGTDPGGFGSTLSVTNIAPASATGGPAATTNVIDTGTTSGLLTLDYNFFCEPDRMLMIYDGATIFDSGLINNGCPVAASVPARQIIPFGPGVGTTITVIMNPGNSASTNTAWEYTVSSINDSHSYLIFTDNTNFTTTPIKFAAPPFVGTAGTNYVVSDFEPPTTPGNYVAPGPVDGWSVLTTNRVTVITNTAYNGIQSLALRSGAIQRTLPTTPGRNYRLGYAYRNGSLDGIISWWRGESNTLDSVGLNHGVLRGGATYAAGMVGQGFSLNGAGSYIEVPNSLTLNLTNAFTIELWYRDTNPNAYPYGLFAKRGNTTIPCNYGINSLSVGVGPYYNDPSFAGVGDDPGTYEASRYLPLPSKNVFHHLAVSFRQAGPALVELITYIDGLPVRTRSIPGVLANTVNTASVLIGASAPGGEFFQGIIDEPTLYGRALTAGEINDIFAAGAAGKCGMILPPAQVCSVPLGAQIFVPGQVTNSFLGNTNWQLGGLIFNATSSNTVVQLAPASSNAPSGVLVDYFTLTETTGNRYVLPEESLKVLEGENAFGLWQVELLDTRTGATAKTSLLDWQLQIIFQTTGPLPRSLVSGVPDITTIPPGQTLYYIVDVPPWARFATNSLLAATGPLNVYFNQFITPTGTNIAPADYHLFLAATSGSRTMTTNLPAAAPPLGTPLLLPGQRYYLAIENPSVTTPVTFAYQVDFDLAVFPTFIDLTNGVPYCAFSPGPNVSLDYYRYTVSSNAIRAQFEIDNPSGDMTLLLQKDLPPTFGVFDYISANIFTNDEVITVFDFSQPVNLSPGDWYMAAVNISGGPVSYCVKAIEWPVYGTNIVITNVFLGTNSFCLTWTSLPGVRYYVEGLTDLTSTNWVTASPTVTATGPTTIYCVPLPSPLHFFRVREGIALDSYFPPPVISNIRRIFQGILITWGGPTNAQYQVQWTPSLAPTNWISFTNPPAVTSPTGAFQFLDNGSETGGFGPLRFYRLLLLP